MIDNLWIAVVVKTLKWPHFFDKISIPDFNIPAFGVFVTIRRSNQFNLKQ